MFISIENLFIFVSASTAKQKKILNHRNRKVAGGTHNVLVHYVNASTPNPSGIVLCNPFKWDILCSFLIKNHPVVVFVPSTTAKWISFCKHRNRKVVGGKYNVLVHYVDGSTPNLSGIVLFNPFKWDILLFIIFSDYLNLLVFPFHYPLPISAG